MRFVTPAFKLMAYYYVILSLTICYSFVNSSFREGDVAAFLASAIYIAAMLGGAALALYPTLLPASTNSSFSLTIYNARTGDYSLRVGLIWWLIGMTLALGYFVFLYRFFWGKVTLTDHE